MQQTKKANPKIGSLSLACALLSGTLSVLSAPDTFDFPETNQLGQAAPPLPAAALNETFAYRKKTTTVADLSNSFKNRIEVKFVDNSGIRLRKEHLTTLTALANKSAVESELKQLESILQAIRQICRRAYP